MKCKARGCKKEGTSGRGLCPMHYRRVWLYGELEPSNVISRNYVDPCGMRGTSTFRSYQAMVARCRRGEKSKDFHLYRGKGIKVCKRWLGWDGFRNFFSDMGKRPSQAHTVDRKRNHLGSSPKNCKWATWTEQARNSGRNHYVRFRGKRLTLVEWEIATGIRMELIRARLKLGWSVRDALTRPTDLRRTGRFGRKRSVRTR
jgi:hypothetical protein